MDIGSQLDDIIKFIGTLEYSQKCHNELEIRVASSMVYEMGTLISLYKANNFTVQILSFVEVVSPINENQKIRLRTKTLPDLSKIPSVVLSTLRNQKYETKTLMSKLATKNLYCTHSLGENTTEYSGVINTAKLYYVQQCILKIKNWIIDFKYKYPLGLDNKVICERIITNASVPYISCEVEFGMDAKTIQDADII